MVFVKKEPIESFSKGNKKSRSKTRKHKRVRRSNDEIDQDIRRYNELIKRDKDLEKDIPPRRSKVKDEESDDVELLKSGAETKSKLLQQVDDRSKATKVRKVPKPTKNVNLPKPNYLPKRQNVNRPWNISSISLNKVRPPSLSKFSSRKFEDTVLLSNTYQDLIKLIKSNIAKENSSINIALHHNLFPKNLGYEKERYELTKDLYNTTNSPINFNFFRSGDIDLFFENLQGNNPESLNEYLKRNVPLV